VIKMRSRESILRRCLYCLTTLFITAGVFGGADAYFTYHSMDKGYSFPPAGKDEPKRGYLKKKKKKTDYAVIVRRNLFSSSLFKSENSVVSVPPKRPAPKLGLARRPPKQPPLRVLLVGTTVGPERVRYAILEDTKSKKHGIHKIGEHIEGALIQKIYRAEVHVLYGGKVQILRAFEQTQK
jgi:hypothetical protein